MSKPFELVEFILKQASERGVILGATKLIKLLYLSDVENYRVHGKTLTGFSWMFFHYGPWTPEYEKIVTELGIGVDHQEIDEEKTFREMRYQNHETEFQSAEINIQHLGIEEKSVILTVLEDWLDKDLTEILNHCYFYTEPMIGAKRGKALNFNKIEKTGKIRKTEISYKRLAPVFFTPDENLAWRDRFKTRKVSKTVCPIIPPRYDEEYFKVMNEIAREDEPDFLDGARVNISLETQQAIRMARE